MYYNIQTKRFVFAACSVLVLIVQHLKTGRKNIDQRKTRFQVEKSVLV
jgi:hypothetical protein